MSSITRGKVPFTRHDVTQEMAVQPDSHSTAMTFTNNTPVSSVTFSVNWNSIRVGSTTVAAGKNGQIGDEWAWYHIQATDADGQVLAQKNNVYGDAQVSLDRLASGAYSLSIL